MSDEKNKPRVVDLNKQDDSGEDEEDDSTDSVAEESAQNYEELEDGAPDEDNTGGDPYDEQRDNYPEAVNEDDDEDPQNGSIYGQAREEYGFDPEEAEKAFSYNDYGLSSRFDEKGFSELEEGDMVVIDTPLKGGKTGEVTHVEEAWTGTLNATVDTGASKHELTPFEDEYSEKFVACISESGEVTDDMLHSLGKTTVSDVDIGTQVMIDVPHAGPTRGMVQEKKRTEKQGTKIVVNTGPVAFDVYSDPSPSQKKESPFLVGRISE